MLLILKFIAIIVVGYWICLMQIRYWRELKIKREESKIKRQQLIKEGNLPREGMTSGAKTLYFMIVSSIIITIIMFYIRKLEFKISMVLSGIFAIFVVEIIIGCTWNNIKRVIRCYKKYGLIKTIFIVIFTILGIAGVLYIKYSS